MSDRRHTIASEVTVEGIGLHLGEQCRLTFRPAPEGSGVRFRRVDLPRSPETAARVEHVAGSERHTQLGTGRAALHTVEHVLAAIMAHEVDDIVVEMDAPEPPIVDGSAAPFFAALDRAGIVRGSGVADYLELREPLRVQDGESVYEAVPADRLAVDVTIDFPHPAIGRQSCALTVTPESFGRELAAARTFGFVSEVEALRRKGLIRGASLENAIVLDADGVLGAALRWPDEFVRHKAMDCIGDLALVGCRVRARITALRPSHRGTVKLVREMITLAAKETGMPEREKQRTLEIEEIMKVLPHRYPFLLVDRIVELEEGRRVVGIKNVTINEPFFQGHYPGHPVMPGVLIVEAMAQVGGMLLLGAVKDPESKVVYFMSLDNIKFRRPVRPGDQLRCELEMQQVRGRVCRMRGVARVDGAVVAEAEMAAMVRDR